MAQLAEILRVGCSGWGYDDWLGGFYPPRTPKADYLRLYATAFDCVEVDSSFYRAPTRSMTRQWYERTPSGFLFALKFPRRITHEKKLDGIGQELGQFYAAASELREKAGPLVVQLPPSITHESYWNLLQQFIKELDLQRYLHTIEFRHRSWFREEVYALLRNANIAMVWTENQYLKSPAELTTDYAYVRMVGDRELTEFGKTQRDKSAEMRAWQRELEEASDSIKAAFVVFNNHYAGFGPASVNEFRRMVGLEARTFPAERPGPSAQTMLGEFDHG